MSNKVKIAIGLGCVAVGISSFVLLKMWWAKPQSPLTHQTVQLQVTSSAPCKACGKTSCSQGAWYCDFKERWRH